jgi:hypothetical protein
MAIANHSMTLQYGSSAETSERSFMESRNLPIHEQYNLAAQIKATSISLTSNAEGFSSSAQCYIRTIGRPNHHPVSNSLFFYQAVQ